MFLNRTFLKTNYVKRLLYTQQQYHREYAQFCHESHAHKKPQVPYSNFNRPCRIDHKRNIIKCRFDVNGCRCSCCPYGIDRIIYYINPTIKSEEIIC